MMVMSECFSELKRLLLLVRPPLRYVTDHVTYLAILCMRARGKGAGGSMMLWLGVPEERSGKERDEEEGRRRSINREAGE